MAARRAATAAARQGREPLTPKGWLVIVGGAATSAVVLAAWLPVGALLHQREKAAAATSRLSQLHVQGAQLAEESARLKTPEERARLAREQYQLVTPGARLIQVLAPAGRTPTTGSGAYTGDPGFTAPVDPSTAAIGPSVATTETTLPSSAQQRAAHASAGDGEGFLARALGALEFWR